MRRIGLAHAARAECDLLAGQCSLIQDLGPQFERRFFFHGCEKRLGLERHGTEQGDHERPFNGIVPQRMVR